MSNIEQVLRSWVEDHLSEAGIENFSPEGESFLIILKVSNIYRIAGQYRSIADSREDCQRHTRVRAVEEVFLLSSVPLHGVLHFSENEFVG